MTEKIDTRPAASLNEIVEKLMRQARTHSTYDRNPPCDLKTEVAIKGVDETMGVVLVEAIDSVMMGVRKGALYAGNARGFVRSPQYNVASGGGIAAQHSFSAYLKDHLFERVNDTCTGIRATFDVESWNTGHELLRAGDHVRFGEFRSETRNYEVEVYLKINDNPTPYDP